MCGGSRVFGLETIALMTAQALRDRGHEISFLVSGWNNGDFIQRLVASDLSYETIFLGRVSKSLDLTSLRYNAETLRHLHSARKRCREHFTLFRPDVVLVHHRDWILLAHSLLRQQRAVYHVHELAPVSRWSSRIYSRIDSAVTGFIAVSEHIASRLAAMGLDPSKVRTVHNGIEPLPLPVRDRSRNASPTIGIIGQIGAWKGHGDLLAALAKLKAAGRGFHCAVFGEGASEYVETLREHAATLGIGESISWRGYVRDRAELFRDIDICVVPSRFDDPCPVIAIEASMRGIPVIASRSGGLPELVLDGQTGLLFEPGNTAELAEKLEDLLDDPDRRAALGTNARARALRDFTVDRMATGIESALVAATRTRREAHGRQRLIAR